MVQHQTAFSPSVALRSAHRRPVVSMAIAIATMLTACGGGATGDGTATPVTIQSQPTDQAVVSSSGVARFTIQAAGTGLTYQWQRSTDAGATWTDISGAVSATLELIGVTTDQNGYQFRAKVSGNSGALTSLPVTLTVNAGSVFSGKSWQTGALLDTLTASAVTLGKSAGFEVGIADSGHVFAVSLTNNDSGTSSIRVTEGTSNNAGIAPTWFPPVTLSYDIPWDARDTTTNRFGLSVSPNGNAVVYWKGLFFCGEDGYFPFSQWGMVTGCTTIMASRKLNGETRWEIPQRVAASTYDNGGPRAIINDRGDVAFLLSWDIDHTINSSEYAALALRESGQSTYRIEYISSLPLGPSGYGPSFVNKSMLLGLDRFGNINVTGQRGTDMVSYQGTVSAGLGSTPKITALENLSTTAKLIAVETGVNGDIAVLWQQDTPANMNAILLSVYSQASGSWTSADVPIDLTTSLPLYGYGGVATKLVVTDDGRVLIYNWCTVTEWKNGSLQAVRNLPANCGLDDATGSGAVFARNGNYLGFGPYGYNGQWLAYDAGTNMLAHAPQSVVADVRVRDFILGTASAVPYAAPALAALAPNGVGILASGNYYQTLPSATASDGNKGTTLINLWGIYFK